MSALRLLSRYLLAALIALAPEVSAALVLDAPVRQAGLVTVQDVDHLEPSHRSRRDVPPTAAATEAPGDTSDDGDLPEVRTPAAILPEDPLVCARGPWVADLALDRRAPAGPAGHPTPQRGPPASPLVR